jgi:acetyl esterase/lipase
MSEDRMLAYGDHPDQYVRCRPAQDAQRGIAVLVHGGYWRERHTADLMSPLAADLARRGWATVNVEYRRGPQAVWPTPLEDVRAACRVAADWAARASVPGPLIGVGHSVGGQLALLAGEPLDGVVALAPVTDAFRIHEEELGDGAAREYFRASPLEEPEQYAEASPFTQLPVGRPLLLVHGGDDDRVPLSHSLAYLAAARDAGDTVTGYFPPRLSHLAAIDPGHPSWEHAISWMADHVPAESTS